MIFLSSTENLKKIEIRWTAVTGRSKNFIQVKKRTKKINCTDFFKAKYYSPLRTKQIKFFCNRHKSYNLKLENLRLNRRI